MASEIRVDKINSLSGVGTVTLSPTGVDIAGITTVATFKVGTGVTASSDGNIFATGVTTATTFSGAFSGSGANITALNASNISSGTVPTARLGSGTASSSTFLRGDSTFQTVNTDLVSDTSPQLGGDLDLNGNSILLDDDEKIFIGTSNDGSLFNSGTFMFLKNHNGAVAIQGTNYVSLQKYDNSDIGLQYVVDGEIKLYHDNSVRAETMSTGFKVKRSVDDSSTTLKLENNSTASSTTPSVSIKVDLANGKNGGSIDFVRVSNYQSSAASDSAIVFKPAKNDTPTEVVRITEDYVRLHSNSSGIQFNSDTAAANALDDYEEGTFTASLANVSAPTYEAQGGTYTKIGRVVHGTITIGVASGLDTSDGSAVNITGLPFTGQGESCVVTLGRYTNLLGSKSTAFRNVRFGGTYIILCENSNATIDYNEISSSGYLQLSFTYHTS